MGCFGVYVPGARALKKRLNSSECFSWLTARAKIWTRFLVLFVVVDVAAALSLFRRKYPSFNCNTIAGLPLVRTLRI